MINFLKVKSRVNDVKNEVDNGGNLAEIYAEYSNRFATYGGDDEEEYEILQEIEVYLRKRIVDEFMKQNSYSRNEEDFRKRWEKK